MPKKSKNKERKSLAWFLKPIAIGSFIWIVTWSWQNFFANSCLKCVLPTFGLTGTVGIIILAILNEILRFMKK